MEKVEILKSIQMIVYYIDAERLNWIKKQIQDLNIEIDIHFFKCFTAKDSLDYITSIRPGFETVETHGQICCLRSFSFCLDWFVNNCHSKEYIITIEDDSCFIRDSFQDRLIDIVQTYKKYKNEFDYICLGYIPFDIFEVKKRNQDSANGIYWNLWKDRQKNEDFDHVWGGQMVLLNKESAKNISSIIHQENTDLIRKKIKERICDGHKYSLREEVLLVDHIIPVIFRQAIYYPPLVIEGDFKTTMEQGFSNWDRRNWKKYIDVLDYYINKKI